MTSLLGEVIDKALDLLEFLGSAGPPVSSARESKSSHRRESQNHATRDLHSLSSFGRSPGGGHSRTIGGPPPRGQAPISEYVVCTRYPA